MTMLAVPNVSEGRSNDLVQALASSVGSAGARVLNVHSDAIHNRSVLTVTGAARSLIEGMVALARAAAGTIDLTKHDGAHPCLGALDVCPIVPHDEGMENAIVIARQVALEIGKVGLPVYVYGEASFRPETRSLPDLRKGGLPNLRARAEAGFEPDEGPAEIDGRRGIVCVGARGPLIAFNVNMTGDVEVARAIAAQVRSSGGGPMGVRALGLPAPGGCQVSMNLIEPQTTGIEAAFAAVERAARQRDVEVVSTELIGLIPDRFLPQPDAKAARLLVEPGRSLETALNASA